MPSAPITIRQHDQISADSFGRPASAVDSWVALSRAQEARLTYPTGHGPRSLPVRYVRLPGRRQLTLRLPEFNDAVHYLDGQDVTVEVPATPQTPGSDAVRVAGRAAVVTDDTVPATVAAGLEHWPAGIVSRFVIISCP